MFRKIVAWFTPERRQLIQVTLGALAVLLVQFGFGTQGQYDAALIITGAAMQFVASLLSLVNLRRTLDTVWTVLRGAIYTLATVVSPALVLLGFYGEDRNAQILTAVSLALSVLSSAVAIFTSARQSQVVVVQETRDEAIVGALTAAPAQQVVALRDAASRLGVDPADVTRALYRDVIDPDD